MHASGNPACRLAFAPDMRLYHVGSPQRQIANFDSPGRRLVRVSVPQSCWEPLNHPGRLKVFRRFKCRCAAVRLRATLSDPMKIDSYGSYGSLADVQHRGRPLIEVADRALALAPVAVACDAGQFTEIRFRLARQPRQMFEPQAGKRALNPIARNVLYL